LEDDSECLLRADFSVLGVSGAGAGAGAAATLTGGDSIAADVGGVCIFSL